MTVRFGSISANQLNFCNDRFSLHSSHWYKAETFGCKVEQGTRRPLPGPDMSHIREKWGANAGASVALPRWHWDSKGNKCLVDRVRGHKSPTAWLPEVVDFPVMAVNRYEFCVTGARHKTPNKRAGDRKLKPFIQGVPAGRSQNSNHSAHRARLEVCVTRAGSFVSTY